MPLPSSNCRRRSIQVGIFQNADRPSRITFPALLWIAAGLAMLQSGCVAMNIPSQRLHDVQDDGGWLGGWHRPKKLGVPDPLHPLSALLKKDHHSVSGMEVHAQTLDTHAMDVVIDQEGYALQANIDDGVTGNPEHLILSAEAGKTQGVQPLAMSDGFSHGAMTGSGCHGGLADACFGQATPIYDPQAEIKTEQAEEIPWPKFHPVPTRPVFGPAPMRPPEMASATMGPAPVR